MSSDLAPHCETVLAAKAASGLTFAQIADKTGKPEVWLAALFFGNATTDAETAAKIAQVIGLKDEAAIKALGGKGPGSLGVEGMVVRGRNWEWPPKVRAGGALSLQRGRARLGEKSLRNPVQCSSFLMLTARTPSSTVCTRSSSSTATRTRPSSKRRYAQVVTKTLTRSLATASCLPLVRGPIRDNGTRTRLVYRHMPAFMNQLTHRLPDIG